MDHYKEFSIKTRPMNTDLLSGIFWRMELSGLEEREDCIILYADQESSITKEKIENELLRLKSLGEISLYQVSESRPEVKNWNYNYEKSLKPIRASKRIIISPEGFSPEIKDGEILIRINPKMSFGTGGHETTRMMLSLLESSVRAGDRMLDLGCGTGVLAIASVLLGGSFSLGIDNDEWCYLNALENASINGVKEQVEIRQCILSDVKEGNFQVIAANIQKNILLENREKLRGSLSADGTLIISGYLTSDKEEITEKFEALGLKASGLLQENEWSAQLFKTI